MDDLTEAEWEEFHQMVEAAGPSSFFRGPSSIVFRGGSEPITIDYVRKPYMDALKMQNMFNDDSDIFNDAGFHTVLQLSKCIEMHMRLLFLGDNSENFSNDAFYFSKCQFTIQQVLKGNVEGHPSFVGFDKKTVAAKGKYWEQFSSRKNKKCWDLWRLAYEIYGAGNPYRHNRVNPWMEVRPIFEKTLQQFEEFMNIFDALVG